MHMFICLNTKTDNWAPIKSTFGVTGIVKFGQEPARVPDKLIQTLQTSSKQFQNGVIDLDSFKKKRLGHGR